MATSLDQTFRKRRNQEKLRANKTFYESIEQSVNHTMVVFKTKVSHFKTSSLKDTNGKGKFS